MLWLCTYNNRKYMNLHVQNKTFLFQPLWPTSLLEKHVQKSYAMRTFAIFCAIYDFVCLS